jgi:putative transposase
MNNLVIDEVKEIFKNILPAKDPRCKVQPLDFITALICGFSTREGRVTSIAALRRTVMEYTQQKLARGTFWERMATDRIVQLLQVLLGKLMASLCLKMQVGVEILQKLSVKRIYLLDSSSFSLPDQARETFPAPRNNVVPAAVKVHALYDLFGAMIQWFDMTPATTHDRKGFPPLKLLIGSLIIFDLGYWDYQLLKDIMDVGGFFLSRVKTNAKITVLEVISGISKTCIGFSLNGGRLDAFRGDIVEFIGEFIIHNTKEKMTCRIIGFWSREDSQYHWYMTNLKSSSTIIYLLYCVRWQLELLWKAYKSFLHLDEINSSNKNIILSIILSGMCAGLLASSISVSVVSLEPEEKQAAFSIQSSITILKRIGHHLFNLICTNFQSAKNQLLKTIILFKDELYDPNYKKRLNTVGQIKYRLEMM